MRRDELRQPLRKRKWSERLWALRPSLLKSSAVVLALGFIAGGYWAVRTPNPFAGEPVLVMAIPAAEPLKTASITPADSAADAAAAETDETMQVDENDPHIRVRKTPGKPVPSIEEQIAALNASNEPQVYAPPHESLPPAPIKELVEVTSQGGLPRIGPGNRKVADAYAKTVPMSVETSSQPKIAILLGGMGLNAKLTEKASNDLPGEVTFAFAPYGNNLQTQVNRVRADGHEVALQLPMEPMGYPANNPGPKTLMAEADGAENADALAWHMSRFTGYSSVTNYMGARMLKSAQALRPLLEELKKRGLVFLEDGNVSDSRAEAVGGQVNLPVRRAAIVIDSDPEKIKEALAQLEAQAKANGFAIGTGTGLETTTEAVKLWAEKLRSKGIILVPLSQAYKGKLG